MSLKKGTDYFDTTGLQYYPLRVPKKPPEFVSPSENLLFQDPELCCLHKILMEATKRAKQFVYKKRTGCEIMKVLYSLIPMEYFGIVKHQKLFFRIVLRILTTSADEHIYLKHLELNWDHKKVPWLKNSNREATVHYQIINDANRWLLDFVVKRVISKVFVSKKLAKQRGVLMIHKHIWMSLHDRALRRLTHTNKLVFNKKTMKVQSALENTPSGGFLNIVPTQGRKLRYIVTNMKEPRKYYQDMSKRIRIASKNMCEVTKTGMPYSDWCKYVVCIGESKLYGIKVDLKDAFGSVKIAKLERIMLQHSKQYLKLLPREKNCILRKIKNQFVYFKCKKTDKFLVREWKRGLLQGNPLSPSLCLLYLSFLDNLYLKEFKQEHCFLHRTVDDYFFTSPKKDDVKRFYDIMKKRLRLNISKTKTNLHGQCSVIPYDGYLFCMETKEVRPLYHFPEKFYLGNKFKFWNAAFSIDYDQPKKFLMKAMMYKYSNNRFSKMFLNTKFNPEQVVLQNFYDSMVYVACKFDGVVSARYIGEIDQKIVLQVLRDTVADYSFRVYKTLLRNEGKYCTGSLTYKLLWTIGMNAFLTVLKRKREMYGKILKKLSRKNYIPIDRDTCPAPHQEYFVKLPVAFKTITLKRQLPTTMRGKVEKVSSFKIDWKVKKKYRRRKEFGPGARYMKSILRRP